jgi:hypothetical protein
MLPLRRSLRYSRGASSDDPPRFSTARAARIALARAEAAVAAIPLATTDRSALTSQFQPEPSGNSLTLYEIELAICHG